MKTPSPALTANHLLCLLAVTALLPAYASATDSCYYFATVPANKTSEVVAHDAEMVLDVIELTKTQVDGHYLEKYAADFADANKSKASLNRIDRASQALGGCSRTREQVERERMKRIGELKKHFSTMPGKPDNHAVFEVHGNWLGKASTPHPECVTNPKELWDKGNGVLVACTGGLEWTQSDNGADVNWNQAKAYCQGLAGGWSSPTVDQLNSLVDRTITAPIKCGRFTCKVSAQFRLSSPWVWSSEPRDSDSAWFVNLGNGGKDSPMVEVDKGQRALCVRQP